MYNKSITNEQKKSENKETQQITWVWQKRG